MQAKLVRSYRSKNGNVTFVYGVSGSKEDLARYAEIQGEYHRTDEAGNSLWFTTRCIGQSGRLIITTNNKVVPDMSQFDQAASLAKQYGGNFGTELARLQAQIAMGVKLPTATNPAPTQTPAPTSEKPVEGDFANTPEEFPEE